ncbi:MULTISPECIES: YfgM family protein [unclassified Moraxella]|uniref:YfgM family protein n=1 Tax=unclassified Moraxella TaxID=2685852 RepID=UPI003AF82509
MVKDVTPSSINDEQQSMQALRQYGSYIIMAIVLALGGYFGYSYWQNHGGRIDTSAANDFAKIQADQTNLTALADTNTPEAKQQLATAQATLSKDLDTFISQHGDSVYTWQALMLKAQQQTNSNDLKGAIATLQKANGLKVGDAGLQAIATLRYAQLQLANNQVDDAQKTLQATLPAEFDASKAELLGDIAINKNDKKTATEQYQKAWQAIEARNENSDTKQDRPLLRLKMENLGLSPKQPDLNSGVVAQPTATASSPSIAVASATAKPSASTPQ